MLCIEYRVSCVMLEGRRSTGEATLTGTFGSGSLQVAAPSNAIGTQRTR